MIEKRTYAEVVEGISRSPCCECAEMCYIYPYPINRCLICRLPACSTCQEFNEFTGICTYCQCNEYYNI